MDVAAGLTLRRLGLAALAALSVFASPARAAPLVLWAWERPEDLRFAGPDAEVAAQTGFIVLTGEGVFARGRRFSLKTAGPVRTAVVHIQIDHRRPLAWTPAQRARAAQAVVGLARGQNLRRVQVDFEVRRSERQVLLDLLADVRRALPRETQLSMTALASWCETETWLAAAPVGEIVPMLFRMGPGGDAILAKLAAGGDFAQPRCRSALAISTDTPIARAPAGRTVYLFSPRSWRAADFESLRRRISRWPRPAASFD